VRQHRTSSARPLSTTPLRPGAPHRSHRTPSTRPPQRASRVPLLTVTKGQSRSLRSAVAEYPQVKFTAVQDHDRCPIFQAGHAGNKAFVGSCRAACKERGTRTGARCDGDKRCYRSWIKSIRDLPPHCDVRSGARWLRPLAASRRASGRLSELGQLQPAGGNTACPHDTRWLMPWTTLPGPSPRPATPQQAVGRGHSRYGRFSWPIPGSPSVSRDCSRCCDWCF
jgi:hypothetical protein